MTQRIGAMPSFPASSAPRRQSTWIYLSIYCPPDQHDDAILHLVRPAIQELRAQGMIERYFFIRYNEGGNHIRLRVKGERTTLLGPVRDILNQRIEDFFAAHGAHITQPGDSGPEGMDDPSWKPAQPHSEQRPAHSYEYDRYVPEFHRYGGGYGVLLSEIHFEHSSDMTIQVIARERELRGAGSLQSALLLMMAATLDAFGLADDEKVDALGRQACYWVRSRMLTPMHIRWFDEEYVRLRGSLQRLLPLRSEPYPDSRLRTHWNDIVTQWRDETAAVRQTMTELEGQGKLFASQSVLMLFYIHMLCNRLGVMPPDETCLANLLHRHYAERLNRPALDFARTPTDELDQVIAPMRQLAWSDRATVQRLSAIGGVSNEIRWDLVLPASPHN